MALLTNVIRVFSSMTSDTVGSLPKHIAIIMDGNNRWASAQGLSANAGHRAGAGAVKEIVNSCIDKKIKYLTLFAFSSENWLRPSAEVQGLMSLFMAVLKRKEINQLHKKNVKLEFIGKRSDFSSKLQENMAEVEKLTASNTGTTVIVAADYGGRWDISNATRKVAIDVAEGLIKPEQIDESTVQKYISLAEYPEPDLCIRTANEQRISNFLLWQFAYTEFYYAKCLWPDFNEEQFQMALDEYQLRTRRFGSHDKPSVCGDPDA